MIFPARDALGYRRTESQAPPSVANRSFSTEEGKDGRVPGNSARDLVGYRGAVHVHRLKALRALFDLELNRLILK